MVVLISDLNQKGLTNMLMYLRQINNLNSFNDYIDLTNDEAIILRLIPGNVNDAIQRQRHTL